MLVHGIFGVLLHPTVDGSKHFQAVGIDVVGLAVLLQVLITPSVKGVVGPCNGVVNILRLVPFGVVALVGTLGHEIQTKELAEVSGRSILMVGTVKVQRNGFFGVLSVLCI